MSSITKKLLTSLSIGSMLFLAACSGGGGAAGGSSVPPVPNQPLQTAAPTSPVVPIPGATPAISISPLPSASPKPTTTASASPKPTTTASASPQPTTTASASPQPTPTATPTAPNFNNRLVGLFATGVDTNGSPLNPGTTAVADPHWTLTQSADPTHATGAALDGAINTMWVDPTSRSVGASANWIEGTWGNGNALVPNGVYVYTTSFTVPADAGSPGLPASIQVEIAADNAVQSVLVNGQDVTPSNIGNVNFSGLTVCDITIPSGVLNAPTVANTLSFSILNSSSQASPQGFLISEIQGSFVPAGNGINGQQSVRRKVQ